MTEVMSSELVGTMDQGKSLRDLEDEDDDEDEEVAQAKNGNRKTLASKNDFEVHDLADEEVHFSLSSSDQYYQYNGNHNMSINNNCLSMGSFNDDIDQPSNRGKPQQPSPFTDVNLHPNGSQSINGQSSPATMKTNSSSSLASQQQPPTPQAVQDQLKSNRILNSISNRLRRGSNYLIAPKLVGQYLLGITIQSWSEFLNTTRMLRAPTNRQQLTRRLVNNLNYFQGNYLCVSMILIIYCILTSPLLLLAIAGLLLAMYLVTARSALGKQMRLMGYRLNLQQQYSCITMVWLPLLWVAGAPSAVFWVIGASFFVVGLHASMYANETRPPTSDTSLSAIEYHNQQMINHGVHYEQRSGGNQLATNQMVPSATHWQLNHTEGSLGQYYNHYQHDSLSPTRRQLYAALPLESPSLASSSLPKDKHSSSSTSGGFMSGAFSQWISFGTINKSPNGGDSSSQSTSGNYQKIPEVKIISQDYAGLGRVYEV